VTTQTDVAARAAAWLAENAADFEDPRRPLTGFPDRTVEEHSDVVGRARAWEAHKAAAGWSGLAVSREYGGQGLTAHEAAVFTAAESRYALDYESCAIAKMMVVPTLLAWGSESQKQTLLPRILDGRDVWCQLYSEPGAGSDLAGLTTRAVRIESGWRITGQKVWNSSAHLADRGYLLARTDPTKPKHQGLTAFLIDMRDPAVDVRPIRQITGGWSFAEVFLDGVEVTDDAVIGAVDDGWRVAITTLMNERLSLSVGNIPWFELLELLDLDHGDLHPELAVRAARLNARYRAVAQLHGEEIDGLRDGAAQPGPEGSILKMVIGRLMTDVGRLAADVLAARGVSDTRWVDAYLGSFGVRIGGGTDEILKNVIADRVLRLPREPRVDRVAADGTSR
jgi:alkylation response protein AidB-like acyl-CoA dehydrogenase